MFWRVTPETRCRPHHRMSEVCTINMTYHCCCYLYSFPSTAVANYHKLQKIKKKLLPYISICYKSHIGLTRLKSRCQRSCILLHKLQSNICFLAIPASRGFPRSLTPFLRLQSQQCGISQCLSFIITSLPLTFLFCLPLPFLRTLFKDYIRFS